MKKVTFNLERYTKKLRKQNLNNNIASIDGVEISSFNDLVKEIAELSYLNQDYMLFYRGQSDDHKNRSGTASSLYPSLYRGSSNKGSKKLSYKTRLLNRASRILVDEIKEMDIIGKDEIIKKRYIQWSILQHYEVCDTPLLDVTHSLRVACSFALNDNSNEWGYIDALALPHVTHRISTNSEEETVIVRLLSISPPEAIRPYHQEGYLVGTEFVVEDYDNKQELDLVSRLVGKYKIKNNEQFWGEGNSPIQNTTLLPLDDSKFLELAERIKDRLKHQENINSNELIENTGKFILNWNRIERYSGNRTIRQFFNNMFKQGTINKIEHSNFQKLNNFRNHLVHEPNVIDLDELVEFNDFLIDYINEIEKKL